MSAADDPYRWAQQFMCCCPWPMDPTCCDIPGPDAPAAEKNRFGRALAIASERLSRLTAGRYGLCEEVVRPCKEPCGPSPDMFDRWPLRSPYAGSLLDPYVWGGRIRNRACGCAADDCSCGPVCKVMLPGPVAEVLAVRVDGELVDPDSYFTTPDGWLVRRSGFPCWPDCQDMTRPDTEPGTFSVAYLRGLDPGNDPDAVRAVTALTCELYKSMCGQKCRIPGRVRTIQREGVTYDIVTDWPKQGTGLDDVDDWLVMINPTGARSVPTVTTPDLPRHRFYNLDC
ncbi:hypothetical protein [Streptomyces sp. NPDC088739]|uniref:hypothetical protein n=1 Tax=Streptomyces sp. NPDC088739 TaxID=3365882 RepID=UPI00382A00DB